MIQDAFLKLSGFRECTFSVGQRIEASLLTRSSFLVVCACGRTKEIYNISAPQERPHGGNTDTERTISFSDAVSAMLSSPSP